MKKDRKNLSYAEKYAMRMMAENKSCIVRDICGGDIFFFRNIPVCTADTVFSLLGRNLIKYYPVTGNYGPTNNKGE